VADTRGPGTRTKARKRALDILFEADLREEDVLETLHERVSDAEPPVRDFTAQIVAGVARDGVLVDDIIASSLGDGWTVSRMARVDRNLARIAVWELWFTDVPSAIAIDEAVGLAGELSTDSSPGFLNGLLGKAVTFRPKTPRDSSPTES
jgi:N utilization substance protein B